MNVAPTAVILCGVDGSVHARHAASAALGMAERPCARLTLVHVAPTRTLVWENAQAKPQTA